MTDAVTFKWATVTDTSPIEIKLDGDTAPLALIPDSLIDPRRLAVGSRVRVELSLRKVVIHGVANDAQRGDLVITDWNDAVVPGFYQAENTALNAPDPSYNASGIVSRRDNRIRQEAWIILPGGAMTISYLRIYDGSAWSAWRRLSPISGDADGLRLFRGTTTYTAGLAVGTGTNIAVTFPAGAFSAPPSVWAIFSNGRVTVSIQQASPPTVSGATFRIDNWSTGPLGGTAYLDWFAMGV